MSTFLKKGFMDNYTLWTKHGELGVPIEDNEEDNDDDNIPDWGHLYEAGAFEDEPMHEVEENAAEEQQPPDELGQVLVDAHRDAETLKESKKFEKMLEDHRKLLYPDCKQGLKKLGTTPEILQWKAANGVSDKGFEELLGLVKKMLPEGNELPPTTYEAKKVVCPLGLDVQKIHTYPNDCILYRGEYEELDECPVYEAKRYKIMQNDPGDVDGESAREKVPAKVMWYFPIIPRLKRLFRNNTNAKLMGWHKEERKKDQLMRHPTNGSQWRNVDRQFPDFDSDPRNIRFGLSTDGMNPFGEWGSSHSTWHVTLCMFNLPSWLCMMRKYILMLTLIQCPKQPGNDIDVYLRPLVDELLLLWKPEGVRVSDEYKQENLSIFVNEKYPTNFC